MHLLRAPPPQHFLQYYKITFHQGVWYITHNANLVQGTSPGVPFHPTPPLDYSSRATQGTVVPQRRWTPAADGGDIKRHVEGADLQLPIYFVNRNGSIGFPLPDILQGCDHNLHNANGFAPLGGRATTHIRINWPGYWCWKRQIATRDETHARNPITLARFMRRVGTSVDKFLRECMTPGQTATDPRWKIGLHGGITQAEVKVIGAIHVSAGSWMPIVQLTRYVI
ncbi:hypothetical protein H4582DRAFT_1851949 [Lactarius indigo]|nr:hypothetical protein H4582DRAFT_1851949 [Lactarius indigo]